MKDVLTIEHIAGVIENLWKETLELEDDESIDRDMNFFQMGGNSLMAMIILDEIKKTYKCEFDINELYTNDTVNKLAELVASKIIA